MDFNTIKPVYVLKPEATEKKFQNFSRNCTKKHIKRGQNKEVKEKSKSGVLSSKVVPETGVEPATNGLGNRCSIH